MDADILIIGSGMGGATLAPTEWRILIQERDDRPGDSPEAHDEAGIFGRGRGVPGRDATEPRHSGAAPTVAAPALRAAGHIRRSDRA